jgi:ubiquinone/menaquinone biosynthesis C-methylase UbiE
MRARADLAHPVFARLYARLTPAMERSVGEHRRRLLSGLSGTVVEVGAGDGMNFAHYPPEVERVLAVEPEPYLRKLARGRAESAPVPVEVIDGRAENLPIDDAAVDAAVASLVLCSVADSDAALVQLFRVLRPGGQLRVFEHVRAPGPVLGRVQRLLDVLWPAIAGGCHTSRDTAAAVRRAGFVFDQLETLRFPDLRLPFPTSPHILGVAIRPSNGADSTVADEVATGGLRPVTAFAPQHGAHPAPVSFVPGDHPYPSDEAPRERS